MASCSSRKYGEVNIFLGEMEMKPDPAEVERLAEWMHRKHCIGDEFTGYWNILFDWKKDEYRSIARSVAPLLEALEYVGKNFPVESECGLCAWCYNEEDHSEDCPYLKVSEALSAWKKEVGDE